MKNKYEFLDEINFPSDLKKISDLSSIEDKNSYILVPDYICEVVPNTILSNNYKLI